MVQGASIVLTADRTLMADYPTLLDGMMGTIQTTSVPEFLMRRCLAPRMPQRDGRAVRAPLGLRRLEAALVRAGIADGQVAVVVPEEIHQAVGADTRIVAISSGDPLGYGMSNTTARALAGGQLYTRRWFAQLCRHLRRLRARRNDFVVVAGGPGAWQLANDPAATEALGIDTVFLGYGERDAPEAFGRILEGRPMPPVVRGRRGRVSDIPPILGPTSMGAVEISRGCGRGCGFCTIAAEPMVHVSVGRIVADVETNVRAGVPNVSLISEDFLRYGSPGTRVSPGLLLDMLQAVRRIPGVRMIQVDHVNVSSAVQFSIEQLRQVREALRAEERHDQLWVNLGVESASGELLEANGMNAKAHPFSLSQWNPLCRDAVGRLAEAGFVPMVSLIVGLPGETGEHVQQSIDFVHHLEGMRAVMFPIFHAPLRPEDRPFGIENMTPAHWKLFRMCYAFNFKWIPPMFLDNHHAGNAPMWRRAFIQLAGRAQTAQWKLKFLRAAWGAKM